MSSQTPVTLYKGGIDERTVPAGQVDIPDLWHIAQMIQGNNPLENPEISASMILQCWHRAHALRECILSLP